MGQTFEKKYSEVNNDSSGNVLYKKSGALYDTSGRKVPESNEKLKITPLFNKSPRRTALQSLSDPEVITEDYALSQYEYWNMLYSGGSMANMGHAPLSLSMQGIELQKGDLLNALYRGYLQDTKYSEVKKYLGMIEAAGTAAIIYMHLKKYGK